ncbi:CAMP-dependent protein kinase regulatory [Cyclospora cayetanensis]|uniref:cAMP-dependent protein kinase regulatory n=1 Tax=Cyclospora cayetanensis TaxID=88456 RepID=A0A1D3DA77_9EIME|nr:CAMP-dependent protein kinase regulatory [Cyclospora cayetanensis]
MQPQGPLEALGPAKAPTGPMMPPAVADFSTDPRSYDDQNIERPPAGLQRMRRECTILQELEAGDRQANERNSLSTRLFELGMELRKVRQVNDILEAENADLRERILHQADAYPHAAEIRALARRSGPELAESVSYLIEENKFLRLKLQSSIRSQARLQGTATELGNALREHEERAYARELAESGVSNEYKMAATTEKPGDIPSTSPRTLCDKSPERPTSPTRGDFVRRYCVCSKKLQELLDCIDSQIGDYERGVWQTQVNVLEEERDNLMLKTVVMRQRLAEVQAKIVTDPFLAARFGAVEDGPGALGAGRARNPTLELRDTIVQLATVQDVNAELERRLASERNISRSWQTNLRALQRELRDHLADLAAASRASGLRCDILRGTLAQAGEAAAMKEIQGFTRSEKESLRLLRQARDRIAADANRIEAYAIRVRELEQEVANLRCDLTQLERGDTYKWEESAQVYTCDCDFSVAITGGDNASSDSDCTVSALRTARQLLVDRAETARVLESVQKRKHQLQTQQLASEEVLLPELAAPGGLSRSPLEDNTFALTMDITPIAAALFSDQPATGISVSKVYDALTVERGRDIFRRLMVLRKIANSATFYTEGTPSIPGAKLGPSAEVDTSERLDEIKHIQKSIDQRERSLQQAEEAMQARVALRQVESELIKKLKQNQEQFEEQRKKDAMKANEEMARQRREYEKQLETERARCEVLRKELELQAMELDLQRKIEEERIVERSQKENLELERELQKLRNQLRAMELEMQRISADAARESLAAKSAAAEERATLSAATQAAEHKANDALKQLHEHEKQDEMRAVENKLKQALASRAGPAPAPPLSRAPEEVSTKESISPLKKLKAAAHKVTMGQKFTRLAREKRTKTIAPPPSKSQSLVALPKVPPSQEPKPKPSDLSPRSYFRKMVTGKYTSLASAFRHMDVDHSNTVKLSEFANFVDDLGMNIPFSDTHDLYNTLAGPSDGMLLLNNFYKNLLGDSCTLTELHRRLEEIFGDVEQPFNDAGIPSEGRVTKEQFILIAEKSGVSTACANSLWDYMDRANRGSLQRENVLLLLEDNVDLDEVERVEQSASNVLTNVLNVFSGTTVTPKPAAKNPRRSSFKKLTYTAAREELGFTSKEAQVDAVLADCSPWDCIYPEDRKEMIADMKHRTVGKGQLIQKEDDPNCPLYIFLKGTVSIFQPGFIQYSFVESSPAPCMLYSENLVEGTPNKTCAKADSDEDVVMYTLDRAVFERSYERLLFQRQREVEDYQKLLRKVPVVNKLDPPLLRCLAASFRKQTFQPDEKIISEGDPANRVLMVKDGEAVALGLRTSKEEVEIRVYRPLDFFGDGTLIKSHTHTASVRARTDCTVLWMGSNIFYGVLRTLETEFRRRNGRATTLESGVMELQSQPSAGTTAGDELASMQSGALADEDIRNVPLVGAQQESQEPESLATAIPAQEKTLVDAELIEKLLQEETERMHEECGLLMEAIPVLKNLPKERRQELCNRMVREIYFPNQAIVLQGEAADKFYIVKSGTVSTEIYVGCGKMQKISEMTSGSFFGEMSIIKHEPRTAYIVAMTPVYVYALKASDFQELLGDTHEAFLEHAQRMYSQKTAKPIAMEEEAAHLSEAELPPVLNLLSGVPVIKLLNLEELNELARAFQVMNVREREVIMHEGDPADKFCIVIEGMVSIQKSLEPGKPRQEVAVVNAGEYLGEIGFLNNQPRTASCVAKTKVKLLYLGRAEFDQHLGRLAEAFLQQAESTYSTQQADIPDWLRDAKEKGAFYDPNAATDSTEDLEEPIRKFSLTEASDEAEANVYKKKKERKTSAEGGAAVVGAAVSVESRDLDRLRDLLAGTFKNKYGSLAHAFEEMDVNKSSIVDADEFYAFIKKSNVRGFRKAELDALFDELCRPIKGRLVVGNLYRNARGVEPTGAEIHLRAIEIYGSVLAAFKKTAGMDSTDLCTRDNFTSLAEKVGVDNDKAQRIWEEYIDGLANAPGAAVLG